MNYHVLTLFPDMIQNVAITSILGRALRAGHISLDVINIRDFSADKNMRVDDYPYGGGAGMVMEAEPVFQAVEAAKARCSSTPRVIYLTPQAEVLSQLKVEELAKEQDLILLCGHYEGIDERVLQETVTDYLSVGDYVLTGGELGACIVMDAVSRFVPGVLSNEESSQFESHQDNLLEYPHFTRPEVWHGEAVPEVLLSGDHAKVEAWRHEQSLLRTKERRPDLLKRALSVHVLFVGGERSRQTAACLGEALSRYSEILDYNRAKLQKKARRFSAQDLVVILEEEASEEFREGAAEDEIREIKDPFRKLQGNGAMLVQLRLGASYKTAFSQEEANGEGLRPLSELSVSRRKEKAGEKEFYPLLFLSVSDTEEETLKNLALDIRRKADEAMKNRQGNKCQPQKPDEIS